MDRKNTSACRGDEDHPFALSFKGGENPKNKSYNVRFDLLGIEDYNEEAEDDVNVELSDELMLGRQVTEETNSKSEDLGENSRSKKKKKNKSGKTAHEEEDLDKILAELGITPVSPAQPELVAPSDCSKDGEEETVLSASSKKRKKKKDKDKKVYASSVEAKDEPSQPHKKVPKHILEMQEMVARRKEAEEMKKKEEEEKLRKEEEERRIQEEREREAEEIKQKRKIREKEKMLKKKQEGGILTEKQKRDKAFKNKMLSDAGMLLASDKQGDSSKRPVYGNKRKPARTKANDSGSVQVKDHANVTATLHDIDSAVKEKKQEAGDEEEEKVTAANGAEQQQVNGGDHQPNSGNNKANGTSGSRAFKRVDADEWLGKKGAIDNRYESTFGQAGWGFKAQQVLGQVRGKDFRHEKTKKKRGSYLGGSIDPSATFSYKFESDDDA